MRLLHVTDTHLGLARFVRGGPRGWSRADDHLAAFAEALRPALEERVDLVVHSGDLFDRSRPPARAVAQAADLLREVARRVPVVLVPGNHDRRGLRRHFPVPVRDLHVVAEARRVLIGDVALGCVPFRRLAEGWSRSASRLAAEGVDLLVAHQAFHGHQVPGFAFEVGRQRDTVGEAHMPSGVSHVLCGHLHPRQVVHVGGAEVVCPGSTERTSFSERDQVKGYALWDLGREVRWHYVDLPSRPMHRVTTAADLRRVAPEDLVRAPPELQDEVLARGAFVVGPSGFPRPRPQPERRVQLALFA